MILLMGKLISVGIKDMIFVMKVWLVNVLLLFCILLVNSFIR